MDFLELVVSQRRVLATHIIELTLAHPSGATLPGFWAGAHINLRLPNGITRAYSLVNPSQGEPVDRYTLAVALAPDSQGGSAYIHEHLVPGSQLQASAPANHFALQPEAAPTWLVAGGIGITPLLAMARECNARGQPWVLSYACQSRAHAAYLDELPNGAQPLQLHFDNEHNGQVFNVAQALRNLPADAQVYCCGPAPMMQAVRDAAQAMGHPASALHFEFFQADPTSSHGQNNQSFEIELSRSGKVVHVAAGQSALDALEEADVIVPSVCREGVCGTCECDVISGEVDHRDTLLSNEEKAANQTMMLCVSRAKGARLVLDL